MKILSSEKKTVGEMTTPELIEHIQSSHIQDISEIISVALGSMLRCSDEEVDRENDEALAGIAAIFQTALTGDNFTKRKLPPEETQAVICYFLANNTSETDGEIGNSGRAWGIREFIASYLLPAFDYPVTMYNLLRLITTETDD